MAKSKIARTNQRLAQKVVKSYKKIEDGVVSSYTKIEDRFVDMYLTREGETVQQAKERLKRMSKSVESTIQPEINTIKGDNIMNTRDKENYEALESVAHQAAEKTGNFLKKAFSDMKENAKAQHEVDKANFEAVKAESKANFEENRGKNTFAKAKADAKKSWEDAKLSPAQRIEKIKEEQQVALADAKERIASANERYNALKKTEE